MAEYGVFNDEGCVERGHIELASAQQIADQFREFHGDDGAYAAEMCPDHDEEPRDSCEECATDDEEN